MFGVGIFGTLDSGDDPDVEVASEAGVFLDVVKAQIPAAVHLAARFAAIENRGSIAASAGRSKVSVFAGSGGAAGGRVP